MIRVTFAFLLIAFHTATWAQVSDAGRDDQLDPSPLVGRQSAEPKNSAAPSLPRWPWRAHQRLALCFAGPDTRFVIDTHFTPMLG